MATEATSSLSPSSIPSALPTAWERICTLPELQRVGRKLVRLQSGRGIILFCTSSSPSLSSSFTTNSSSSSIAVSTEILASSSSTPSTASSDIPTTNLYAMDHACYHHGGPLVDGDIEDFGHTVCVSCPWHKYKISLQTGECLYIGLDFTTKTQLIRSKGIKQRVHPIRIELENSVPVIYICDITTIHTVDEAQTILQYETTTTTSTMSNTVTDEKNGNNTTHSSSIIHVTPGIELWFQQQRMNTQSHVDSDVYANLNFNSDKYSCSIINCTGNSSSTNSSNGNIPKPSSPSASSLSSTVPLHSTFMKQ